MRTGVFRNFEPGNLVADAVSLFVVVGDHCLRLDGVIRAATSAKPGSNSISQPHSSRVGQLPTFPIQPEIAIHRGPTSGLTSSRGRGSAGFDQLSHSPVCNCIPESPHYQTSERGREAVPHNGLPIILIA